MCKKVKTTKFKVIDAEINKKLVGEVLVMQKIKPKGDRGNSVRKPTKSRKAPAWFNDFITNKFNKLEKEVLNLRSDVSNLRHDVENLKNGVISLTTRIDNLVKVNSLKE